MKIASDTVHYLGQTVADLRREVAIRDAELEAAAERIAQLEAELATLRPAEEPEPPKP